MISCVEKPPGATVRTLSNSWVNNTSCLRAHQILVEGLIKNYTEQEVSKDDNTNLRGK